MMATASTWNTNTGFNVGPSASIGVARFVMPAGAPVVGLPAPPTPTTRAPRHHARTEHHGRRYAVIALTAAALVLAGMAAFQYARTNEAPPTTAAVSGVPAEFAGVSVPQAMRLADAGVPAG